MVYGFSDGKKKSKAFWCWEIKSQTSRDGTFSLTNTSWVILSARLVKCESLLIKRTAHQQRSNTRWTRRHPCFVKKSHQKRSCLICRTAIPRSCQFQRLNIKICWSFVRTKFLPQQFQAEYLNLITAVHTSRDTPRQAENEYVDGAFALSRSLMPRLGRSQSLVGFLRLSQRLSLSLARKTRASMYTLVQLVYRCLCSRKDGLRHVV